MEKTLKWTGTGICILCMLATSLQIHPINIILGVVGNGLWTTAGVVSRDTPLWVSSAISTAIFIGGVIYNLL